MMSMQIGSVPIGPAQQEYPHEKVLFRSQEAPQAAAILSSMQGDRNQQEKAVDIKRTTEELERISLAFNRRLQFMVDHESREVTVKVIDTETDKVIKVLPPEELQRMHQRIRETMGFLFDQKV